MFENLSPTRGATILIVEDSEEMQEVICSVLSAEGYTLLKASDGPSAMNTFASNQDIDLVFTDLVLPSGVSGVELMKKMAQMRPETLFLLGSGYPQKGEMVSKQVKSKRNISFIAKPYDIDELAKEVRYLLGQAALHNR